MQILSINIGAARTIDNAKGSGQTGIYKHPVDGRVQVIVNGLAGDAICDTENHGGVDQAVYVYGTPDYAWWSAELARELTPGTFSENLTITGLESAGLAIGDRLHVGDVILEVTAPRIPCGKLAQRMGDPAFVKRFRAAERPGLYCRVVSEGAIQAGETVTLESYPGESVKAIELFRDFYAPDRDPGTIRRHLAAPIAIRARIEKEQQLRELVG